MSSVELSKSWLVTCGERADRRIIVEAACYKVEDGCLVFRNHKTGYGAGGIATYPEAVRSFAAGYWRDVESITKDQVAVYESGDE